MAKNTKPFITEEEKKHLQGEYNILKIEDNWKHFESVCERTGLHPSKRQVYPQGRTSRGVTKLSVEISIDGFRTIAARSGEYAGSDDVSFDNEQKPTKATVTVYRLVGGVRCPFTASARMEQYRVTGKQGFMWDKMPHVMLGKCAEALALRKGFPDELSGLYTDDEMGQADNKVNNKSNEVIEAKSATPKDVPKQTPQDIKEKPYPNEDEMADLERIFKDAETDDQLADVKKYVLQFRYHPEQRKSMLGWAKEAKDRVDSLKRVDTAEVASEVFPDASEVTEAPNTPVDVQKAKGSPGEAKGDILKGSTTLSKIQKAA